MYIIYYQEKKWKDMYNELQEKYRTLQDKYKDIQQKYNMEI